MYTMCPKEVACMLGVSERQAQRLMRTGEILSFRAGEKLLRTQRLHVDLYISRQYEAGRPPRKALVIEMPVTAPVPKFPPSRISDLREK